MEFELNSELLMDARYGNGLSEDELRHFFLNYSFKSTVSDTFKYLGPGRVYIENFGVQYGNSSKF